MQVTLDVNSIGSVSAHEYRPPLLVQIHPHGLMANRRVEHVIQVLDDSREKEWVVDLHPSITNMAENAGWAGPSCWRSCETSRRRRRRTDGCSSLCCTEKEAARVEATLRRQGFSVRALHGDMAQSARLDALQQFRPFRDGSVALLVATEVATRGLDIPNVDTVINYSFPLTIEDYVHRIRRTGALLLLMVLLLLLLTMCSQAVGDGADRRSRTSLGSSTSGDWLSQMPCLPCVPRYPSQMTVCSTMTSIWTPPRPSRHPRPPRTPCTVPQSHPSR